ncbi:MAG: hypothetical protein GY951_10895, partial [Psychromonas sp.]|nr:hypothetical protein [Alteromonadales bacterium]MCP5078545.1 hypothetical protein [Psychromonas sp.]
QISATDADGILAGSSITINLEENVWVKLDATNHAVTKGLFDFETQKNHSFQLNASDGSHADIATLTINVVDVNETPILVNKLPDQITREDEPYSYEIPAATFLDGDAGSNLTLTVKQLVGAKVEALPAWLKFNAGINTLHGTPINADVGELTLVVTATDLIGLAVQDTFTLTVENTNDSPSLNANFSVSYNEDQAPVLITNVNPLDDDLSSNPDEKLSLTLAANVGKDLFELKNNGELSLVGALDYEKASQHVLTITVKDVAGETFNTTVTINVVNLNDNAPVISDYVFDVPENTSVASILGQISATDADGILAGSSITINLEENVWVKLDATNHAVTKGLFDFETQKN